MIKARITKVIDDMFEGQHPNGIDVGYTKAGYLIKMPTIDETFKLYSENGAMIFHTSTVVKVVNEYIFETLNSTYKLDLLD